MTNPQKAKGAAFERLIADYLLSRSIPCERIPAGATLDRGDLWIPIIEYPTIDCKNHRSPQLSAWVDRAGEQAHNAGRHAGVVVHKRHGVADPARQFVTTDLDMFLALMGAHR
ncbi:MAG: hypothetical protein KGR18_10105 [Acidobacteria bacterium]|nr:hypothetical protein [Acidobacteriota bacterium]